MTDRQPGRTRRQVAVPAGRPVPVIRPEPEETDAPRSCLGSLGRVFVWGLILAAFAAAGGLFAAALIFGWQWRDEGRVLPGIHVGGTALGGLSEKEAAEALAAAWARRQIKLTAGGQVIPANPAELGFALDPAATAAAASSWSRRTDFWRSIEFVLDGGEVAPVWTFDPAQAANYLRDLAPRFDVTPVNAGMAFADGQLVETPPLPGQALDLAATQAQIEADPAAVLAAGRLPLIIRPVPPAITSTASLIARANERLTVDLSFRLFDPISGRHSEGGLPAADWTGWLAAVPAGANEIEFSVNQAAVQPYLQKLGAALEKGQWIKADEAVPYLTAIVEAQLGLGSPPKSSLRIYHADRERVVQSGDTLAGIARETGFPYPWLQQANPGIDTLIPGQVIKIPSPDLLLPLPVIEHKRIVISLGQQKLRGFENGAQIWEWTISTGIDSSPTSPGIFQIQTREPEAYASNWDLWMPLFMGIYRPVPTSDFMNGFHGFPTRNGSQLLWTNSLGSKVTYGCILVGNNDIQALYEWGEEGTVVEIIP